MKKIKVKNLLDLDEHNIDDIYSEICQEIKHDFKKANINNKDLDKPTKPNKVVSQKIKVNQKNDDDLLMSMTKRLNIVEAKLKECNGTISNKDKEIRCLTEKVARLEKEKEKAKIEDINAIESNDTDCENCLKLYKQLDSQSKYIDKLYQFLKENGITIINSANNPKERNELNTKINQLKDDLNQIKAYENADFDNDNDEEERHLPKQIDIKILIQRIGEMNSLLYQDGASTHFTSEDGKIFKMTQRKELQITFFQNGVIIEGYQFLPYSSSLAQKVLHDILDGYSPFILKERYPDGILLKPVNSVDKVYEEKKRESKPSDSTIAKVDSPKAQKMISAERFLDIFPTTVIKNGNIHKIKEDMEILLNLKTDVEYNLDKETFVLYDEKEKIEEKDIAKIKLKINPIDKIVNVHINRNDTIKPLFDFVKEYSNQTFSKNKLILKIQKIDDYGFVMNYPFKLIKYDTKGNIDELGLFPSIFLTFDVISKYTQQPSAENKK